MTRFNIGKLLTSIGIFIFVPLGIYVDPTLFFVGIGITLFGMLFIE